MLYFNSSEEEITTKLNQVQSCDKSAEELKKWIQDAHDSIDELKDSIVVKTLDEQMEKLEVCLTVNIILCFDFSYKISLL